MMDVLLRGGPHHGEELSAARGDEIVLNAPRKQDPFGEPSDHPSDHPRVIRYKATGRYERSSGRRIFEYVEES